MGEGWGQALMEALEGMELVQVRVIGLMGRACKLGWLAAASQNQRCTTMQRRPPPTHPASGPLPPAPGRHAGGLLPARRGVRAAAAQLADGRAGAENWGAA